MRERNESTAKVYNNHGLASYDQGKLDEAIANYNKALELDPNLAAAYNNRGLAYQGKGMLAEAIADYNKALELDPKLAAAYCNYGFVYQVKGMLDEASAHYNKALEFDPKLASAYKYRGFVYQAKGKLDEAIANYNKALELDPKLADAYCNLGVVYQSKGMLNEAIASYNKAVELNPQYVEAYCNLGFVYYTQNKRDEAIIKYTKALELNPNFAPAYNNRGGVYKAKWMLDEAIADYTKALELDPNYVEAYCNLASAYYNQYEWDEAIVQYSKALELDPKCVGAYNNRGIVYRAKGMFDEAIANFTMALELDPNWVDSYYQRGTVYCVQNKLDEPIADYTKAALLDDKYKCSLSNQLKGLFQLAVVNGRMRQIKEILAIYPLFVHLKDTACKTMLHLAAQSGKVDVLNYLLNQDADIHALDKNKNTPLHYAIKARQLDAIEYLIAGGACLLHEDDDERNALAIAIQTEHRPTILLIAQHMLNPVAEKGNDTLLNFLITQGISLANQDDDGLTPLHAVVCSEVQEDRARRCIELMFESENVLYLTKDDQILSRQEFVNFPDYEGTTALHYAAKNNKAGLIDYLVSMGADLTICDDRGYSILHYAASSGSVDCVDQILAILQSHASRDIVDALIDQPDCYGNTPLIEAAGSGHVNMIVHLIGLGANMFASSNAGCRAIDCAIHFNRLDTVIFLHQQGQGLYGDVDGIVGLHRIAVLGHIQLLKYFIEQGEALVSDKYGNTPLMLAAKNGHVDCLEFMLSQPNIKYADNRYGEIITLTQSEFINLGDNKGLTALHMAAMQGQTNALKLLIEQGADTNCKNDNGETPLDLAKAGDHIEAIEFITHYQINHEKQNLPEIKEKGKEKEKEKEKSTHIKATFLIDDPYAILGIAKDASVGNIKKSYYKKMYEYHPDRAEYSDEGINNADANEISKRINWAYKILTDPEERKKWEASQAEADAENYSASNVQISASTERPSEIYKRCFAKLDNLFQTSPLKPLSKESTKKSLAKLNVSQNKIFGENRYQDLYHAKDDGIEYPNVYQYIQHLAKASEQPAISDVDFKKNITPQIAIDLLLRFLAGEFYGENLTAIQSYFQAEINKINSVDLFVKFYQSIQTIVNITSIEKEYQAVLDAVKGIYSVVELPHSDKDDIARLMQDKYYRYLVADAHCYFWKDDVPVISKAFLSGLKSELSTLYVLPWGKMLLRLEHQMLKAFADEENLEAIYECAYLLIDLSDCYVTYAMVINSVMLAGLCFQYAASKETQPSKIMAAERIALSLYQKAMRHVFYSGPMEALYASTHIAKFASELVYNQSTFDGKNHAAFLLQSDGASIFLQSDTVIETIEGAIEKALYCLDLFPIFTPPMSTFDLEIKVIFKLKLIHTLLKSLLNQNPLASDQDATKVVYELYNNAIRKWCETEADREKRWEKEIKFKLLAIQLLLEKDNSDPDEMERLIEKPYIHMKRDNEGFLVNGELCFTDGEEIYKSFDGFEINHATGTINLLLQKWHEGDSPSLRLFTNRDISQMIVLGITGGALSLDPNDPHKKYHPLLMVSYAPSCIKDTEFLKNLFMVDYLLKMFVTGVEISADSPHLVKHIDNLLALLPRHLREILNVCSQQKSHKIRNHRFWITTEKIERQEVREVYKTTIHYGNVDIAVKTHPLASNAKGDLLDSEVDTKGDSPENHFARNFTEHYHEIGSYFPEFARLIELHKIAAAVGELRQMHKQNPSELLKKELGRMGLPDVPVTSETLSPTSLRAPAIYHQYKDAATNLHQRIYGGVIALPKFSNKIFDTSSKLFKTTQERTAIRAKEFTSHYSKNPNPGNQSESKNKKNYAKFFQEHFAAENATRFKPVQSNPCSMSAFIKSALVGGYDAMDMTGKIPHEPPNPVSEGFAQLNTVKSYVSSNRVGSMDEHPGAEEMGLYLGGMARGLYEQWKACKASKKDETPDPEKESKCDATGSPKFGL